MRNEALIVDVLSLQNMMVAMAEGSQVEKEAEFARLREAVTTEPTIDHLLPRFVRTCRSKKQFWGYIKEVADKYEPRRKHIYGEWHLL